MLLRPLRTCAIACLCLASQLADARSLQSLQARDSNSVVPGQGSVLSPTPAGLQHPTSPNSIPTPTGHFDSVGDEKDGRRTTSTPRSWATTTFPAPSSRPSIISRTKINNNTYSTIPKGELPLKPSITPGWAVAGVIMILSGLFYTVIGIKNGYLHAFLSMAYISALGVAVLIVYVMNLPVSNAAQGGYVVAVVLAGCALGGGSAFFKELTEGLGCALGGFCIAMWLLCLVPGGLISAAAGKAIFIAGFTLVGFAFYFSRWTRDWAMIILIAFSGSTVVTLGIDCYSRAGLKEFWAYVWDLNDNLFPLGADTYPITKGIRVEAALTILLSLIGIISQIKLWRIVREQRKQRAANRAEGQRDLEAEEENVGRIIQEQTARDRAEWERVYGDEKEETKSESRVSGSISADKEMQGSQSASTYAQSRSEGLEKSDAASASGSQAQDEPLMSSKAIEDGKLTVRVACDESVAEGEETIADEKAIDAVLESPPAANLSKSPKPASQQQTVTPAPEIVPLPFKVPKVGGDGDGDDDDDDDVATKASVNRSSFATFATFADEVTANGSVAGDAHHDDGKRLRVSMISDARSSLAATLDDESVSGGKSNTVTSLDDGIKKRRSATESAETKEKPPAASDTQESKGASVTAESKTIDKEDRDTNIQPHEEGKVIIGSEKANVADGSQASVHTVTKGDSGYREIKDKQPVEEEPDSTATQQAVPDKQSEVESSEVHTKAADIEEKSPEVQDKNDKKAVAASLTKEWLPKSLSKVALSYRTNEWAKHLSLADAPEPDEIRIRPSGEVARAVDVEDLQKTAEDEVPCGLLKRSDSKLSHCSSVLTVPAPGASSTRPISNIHRQSAGLETIAERRGVLMSSPLIRDSENEEENIGTAGGLLTSQSTDTLQRPSPNGVVSFSSPQTLLGQREQWLRNKAQGTHLCQSPESPAFGEVSASGGEGDLLSDYSMYAAALTFDPDNVPLSQRKEMMRQGAAPTLSVPTAPGLVRSNSGIESAEGTTFNSHQPKRMASVPTRAAREARLANFRQSVAQDLRAPGAGGSSGTTPNSSTLSGYFNVEKQRNYMMNQMEADSQRRDQRRKEKEARDSLLDSRMRNGDLFEAHREVLRRMQSTAKDA